MPGVEGGGQEPTEAGLHGADEFRSQARETTERGDFACGVG